MTFALWLDGLAILQCIRYHDAAPQTSPVVAKGCGAVKTNDAVLQVQTETCIVAHKPILVAVLSNQAARAVKPTVRNAPSLWSI